MDKVIFAVWNILDDERELLNKIQKYLVSKLNKPVEIKIDDLKSIGSVTYDGDKEIKAVVTFGKNAANYSCSDFRIIVPDTKEMMPSCRSCVENKKTLMEALNRVAEAVNKPRVVPTHIAVETKEKVSVGLTACDINITKDEVEHIKRIRDILGGGKIVITKGDIKVEVDND